MVDMFHRNIVIFVFYGSEIYFISYLLSLSVCVCSVCHTRIPYLLQFTPFRGLESKLLLSKQLHIHLRQSKPSAMDGHLPSIGWSPTRRKYTANSIHYCHTRLHLGFSAKLRIWQISACKMEPRSGIILLMVTISCGGAGSQSLSNIPSHPTNSYV